MKVGEKRRDEAQGCAEYIDAFIQCDNLNLEQIAQSGQCFRWKEIESGRYFVISADKAACFVQETTGIRLICRAEEESYFRDYLDLDTDYQKIIEQIDPEDSFLCEAAKKGKGIRILRQDLWETLISFLISQRNNIPRIVKSIDLLCKKFGDPLDFTYGEYGKKQLTGYSFPSPEQIASADLSECKFGYREKYIKKAAKDVLSGAICLEDLKENGTKEQWKELSGVGDKVASCIQLFGQHQLSVFPVDTWIGKVEEQYYGGHFPVEAYADCAGVMQQYLFYGVREEAGKNNILKKSSAPKVCPEKKDGEKGENVLEGQTLYISDLDGTLLNEEALLPVEAAERLNALIEKGLHLTVATARTYATAIPIVKELSLTVPMILMNGVMLYDPVERCCLDAEIIEKDSVDYILKGRKQFGITGFVNGLSPGSGEGNRGRQMNTFYEALATPQMRRFCEERKQKYDKPFSKTESLEEIAGEDIIYFSFCYKEETLRPFYEYLKKDASLHLNFYEDVYGDQLWYLEISHVNASKYHGVEKLRTLLKPEKIVGFGDNMNDIPMFEACDRSCAVGNAREPVQKVATRVIDTNKNLGVVQFLEEDFAKKESMTKNKVL